jgi:4-hydroxy-3-methylbut-2-enyl diphosphate reductase
LTQIALSLNPRSYQVQSAEELQPVWFRGAKSIGVSAGASTPDWILRQVVDRLLEITGGRVEEEGGKKMEQEEEPI